MRGIVDVVVFTTVVGVSNAAVGMAFGYWLGYRRGQRTGARWLVRPHTARSMARMPLPEQGTDATVQEAVFGRTNLPNSTSEFR